MQSTLSAGAEAPGLRADVQTAIAASPNDSETAVEPELLSLLSSPALRGVPVTRAFLQFFMEGRWPVGGIP